jgi:hypothetical protein
MSEVPLYGGRMGPAAPDAFRSFRFFELPT